MEWITLGLAILGTVTGVVGTSLGVWSYRRDTARVKVSVSWDMSTHPPIKNDEQCGLLRIENVGRRPIFVSHAHIRSENSKTVHLLPQTIDGYRVSEGDKPVVVQVTQKGMEQFADEWKSVCIVVEGPNNAKYVSNFPDKKPSWAN
jgi:hypothetical protein